MKALEKEPRHAATARRHALAADVERFLADEPVMARPPSTAYRAQKFLKKYRGAVTMAMVVASILVGAIVAVSYLYTQARRARREAELLAVENKGLADRNQKVVDAFVQSFESVNPLKNLDVTREMTAEDVLDRVATALANQEPQQMDLLTRATLLSAIGSSWEGLGRFGKAISAHKLSHEARLSVLGPEHPETLSSLHNLGVAYDGAGELDKAISILKEVHQLRSDTLGAENPRTLDSLFCLGQACEADGRLDEAILHFQATRNLRESTLGVDHPDTIRTGLQLTMCRQLIHNEEQDSIDRLLPTLEEMVESSRQILEKEHDFEDVVRDRILKAGVFMAQEQPDLALAHLEQVGQLCRAKLGRKHPRTLTAMSLLASLHQENGQLTKAISIMEEVKDYTSERLGSNHPDVRDVLIELGDMYSETDGRLSDAIQPLKRALSLCGEQLGEDHADTANCRFKLAWALASSERYEEAIPYYEQYLDWEKQKLGPDHAETLLTMDYLARAYRGAGEMQQAFRIFNDLYSRQKNNSEDVDARRAEIIVQLAYTHFVAGDGEIAIRYYLEALDAYETAYGPNDATTIDFLTGLAGVYVGFDQLDEALPIYKRVVDAQRQSLGVEHEVTQASMQTLAMALQQAERYDEALPLFEEVLKLRQATDVYQESTLSAMLDLARCYRLAGQSEKSIPWLRETLPLCLAKLGRNHALTLETISLLSETQKGYAGNGGEQQAESN